MKTAIAIIIITSTIALASILLQACNKTDAIQSESNRPLSFQIPAGFPQPAYNFASNPLTSEGFELGRRLFYDGQLSKDGNFSCASCHQQFAAFSTYDHDLSHGFNNSFTTRNAPGLFNLAWQTAFHHDGGINNLEVQPLAPLTATNEMAETIENVVQKLQADSLYPKLFKKAFGSNIINSQRLLKALSQFTVSLVSAQSKWDNVKKGAATFTANEEMGYALFTAKCASCHKEPFFSDYSYRNNGLPMSPYLKDVGRMAITMKGEDSLKFKVPSLRNVALTGPYMHDGRFRSLRQCIEHYRSGIVQSSTTDPLLKNKILLSETEVTNLLAFLNTLTDHNFLQNNRFSQPVQ